MSGWDQRSDFDEWERDYANRPLPPEIVDEQLAGPRMLVVAFVGGAVTLAALCVVVSAIIRFT